MPRHEGHLALVRIPPGASATQVAAQLHTVGLIRDPRHLAFVARLSGADRHLMAGTYQLGSHMSLWEILNQLTQGAVWTQRVVIPEGADLERITAILSEHGIVDADRFRSIVRGGLHLQVGDVYLDTSLEGYLFPDTYDFAVGSDEADVVRTMVQRFRTVVLPAFEAASTSLGLHEVVTLASIVELEAQLPQERPLIAGVYLNRLRAGMRLQADPTVRYALEEPPSRLLFVHLEVDSPYNTYRHVGLPPGPIASPGLAAISAVLEPEATDMLFFVARGDGSHQFSRTYEEHLAAIQSLR